MARILIADTDKPTRDLLRMRMSAWGHDVVSYADGYAALQATREDSFDLVLLDADLPRLCGLDVLSTIRREQTEPMVVVVLSEPGRRGVAAAAYELGADEVMFKPFTAGFMNAFSLFLASDIEAVEDLRPVALAG